MVEKKGNKTTYTDTEYITVYTCVSLHSMCTCAHWLRAAVIFVCSEFSVAGNSF